MAALRTFTHYTEEEESIKHPPEPEDSSVVAALIPLIIRLLLAYVKHFFFRPHISFLDQFVLFSISKAI